MPKSALFKTMGYSPGFLLKIGGFRNLRNSPQIFRNNPESTCKCICKHIEGISGNMERFPTLAQIGPVQNHGLYPRLFAQNRWISEPSEFTPNLQEQSRKYLQMHLQAHRGHFREYGTIPNSCPNRRSSKPWAIAQAFCSKSVDFGTFGIHPIYSGTIPKALANTFTS